MKKSFKLWFLLAFVLCLMCFGGMALAEGGVSFSHESGFYMEPITVTITADEGTTVYYTLDGTVPDETDRLYEGPLTLDLTTAKPDPLSQIEGTTLDHYDLPPVDFPSAHILRAVAISPDGSRSAVTSGTFFVGFDRQELYGDLPIVSLMIEPDALFDYNTGIYMLGRSHEEWKAEQEEPFEAWEAFGNYSNRGREWERPLTVEFIMEDEVYEQDLGVRIKGGTSRTAPQKSLRLIAREDYGLKNIKYPLYPDCYREEDGELLKKYKSVTLRNGGNDRGFALIRDPMISRLATGMRFETAANRPVVAFINGEYWGIYTLNEEYNDNYIDYHYCINNDNVVTVKNNEIEDGEEEDEDLYWEMYDFIIGEDMTDPEIYAQAGEMLDLGSYVDYMAVTFYIHNTDSIFQDNNWQMWRVRVPGQDASPLADGKWRMMLFDTDSSSGVYDGGSTYGYNNLNDYLFVTIGDDGHPAWILEALMENEDFKRELIIALCDVRNYYFQKDRVKTLLDTMAAWYTPQAAETYRRFGPFWGQDWDTEKAFTGHIKDLGVFFEGRYGAFPYIVQNTFELSEPVYVTIGSADGSKGAVYANHCSLPITDPVETRYFTEYSITLTAEPAEGASFTGWQVEGDAQISDPAALTTEVTFTGNFTITALFD